MENEITNDELTDEQMDQLVDGSDGPTNTEIPMSDKTEAPTQGKDTDSYLEFVHNGKPIKAKLDQAIKWSQQGYDYAQKMQAFNTERQSFESQRKEWEAKLKESEEKFKPYQQVDEWAAKNPTEWQRIQLAYQQQQTQTTADPYVPVLNQYKQELDEVKSFINQAKEREQQAKIAEEDQKLEQDIKSISEQYADIDFQTPDESGKSLMFQVIDHANKNGIRNYKTAFKDFYHDKLIERASNLAKQGVSRDIQKNSKLGILGVKNPMQGNQFTKPKSIKETSYDDLAAEALAELRGTS